MVASLSDLEDHQWSVDYRLATAGLEFSMGTVWAGEEIRVISIFMEFSLETLGRSKDKCHGQVSEPLSLSFPNNARSTCVVVLAYVLQMKCSVTHSSFPLPFSSQSSSGDVLSAQHLQSYYLTTLSNLIQRALGANQSLWWGHQEPKDPGSHFLSFEDVPSNGENIKLYLINLMITYSK